MNVIYQLFKRNYLKSRITNHGIIIRLKYKRHTCCEAGPESHGSEKDSQVAFLSASKPLFFIQIAGLLQTNNISNYRQMSLLKSINMENKKEPSLVSEQHKITDSRRQFLKKAAYAAPKIVALGYLARPENGRADDSSGPKGPPGGWNL